MLFVGDDHTRVGSFELFDLTELNFQHTHTTYRNTTAELIEDAGHDKDVSVGWRNGY